MIRKTPVGIAAVIALGSGLAMAQSVHLHGEGRLNIAIEGKRIFMQLESPGADIVGFEHEARSSDHKAALFRALELLDDPAQLMRFDPGAECGVRQARAEFEGEHDAHQEHEHGDDAHDGRGHEGHDDEARDDHADEQEHGSFVAEYEFECRDIGELGYIEFNYFNHFGNAQSLDVVLIDGSGQRQVDIDRANPVLRLAP